MQSNNNTFHLQQRFNMNNYGQIFLGTFTTGVNLFIVLVKLVRITKDRSDMHTVIRCFHELLYIYSFGQV